VWTRPKRAVLRLLLLLLLLLLRLLPLLEAEEAVQKGPAASNERACVLWAVFASCACTSLV
jgi:hypothetical protein